jgi:thioredoxin-related protein
MKSVITFLLLFLIPIFGEAQSVKWISIEQLQQLSKKEKRKVMIDVYTSWCGWCKTMDKNTFNYGPIAKYLNENYYAVKLNAESNIKISFNGKEYGMDGKYNEISVELLRGEMGFPTTVFLDEEFNMIQSLPGYIDADKFEMIIQYFGDDYYKKIPWSKYERTYSTQKNARN